MGAGAGASVGADADADVDVDGGDGDGDEDEEARVGVGAGEGELEEAGGTGVIQSSYSPSNPSGSVHCVSPLRRLKKYSIPVELERWTDQTAFLGLLEELLLDLGLEDEEDEAVAE